MLLLLGHSLGVGYLEIKAKRAEAGGMYVAALQAQEEYATIEWDDFVYYPRAIAVARGWWPIDPWVYHDRPMSTWGIIPPLPAVMFGLLLRATGDIDTALYIASVLSTLLIGLMLTLFLEGPPVRLSRPAALLAAIVFVKMPWLAVKAQQGAIGRPLSPLPVRSRSSRCRAAGAGPRRPRANALRISASDAARPWSYCAPTIAKKISVESTENWPPTTIGLPKSAMLSMKPTRKAFASPGFSSGSVIVKNVVRRSARKVCAASSSDGLMPATTPRTIMKAIGVNANSCASQMPKRP